MNKVMVQVSAVNINGQLWDREDFHGWLTAPNIFFTSSNLGNTIRNPYNKDLFFTL